MSKNTRQFTDLEHLELVARRIAESGIDITADYQDWINVTFACASLGEAARESYHTICRQYPGYRREECDGKFDNCLRTGRDSVSLATLLQRAKDAEARVSEATNRKKKVRAIQGIAMRFYRTPNWEVRLQPAAEAGKYDKVLRNRNAGNIEFDFVTGASVMLWDFTQYFNKDHKSRTIGDTKIKTPEVRKFDQDFAYDLGIYVGFGGSNLFKNFYVGPSFRFVDFFYFTVGVNIAEYNVLVSGYKEGDVIGATQTIDDVTAKSWLMKPFLALSIDLDFLSYIKK